MQQGGRRLSRLLTIVITGLLCPVASLAQQGATVAGRTLDSASRAPIAMVTVVIVNAASGDTLSGTLTGADGRFLVRGLMPGRYTIAMRFPGLTPAERSLLVSELNLSYDLGDILVGRLQTLAGVAVTADAIRTAALNSEVFRLGEGTTPTTGSVLDALKNVPGVSVDPEGRVLLRGSDRVAVLAGPRAAFLCWHSDSRRLTKRARAAMLGALERPVFVSTVSIFELSTTVRLGKLAVPNDLLNELAYVVESDGFRVLALDAVSAVRAGLLPGGHRDPFDRLLAAQAIVHRCAVITPDRVFLPSAQWLLSCV